MLRKVNNSTHPITDTNYLLMVVYNQQNPEKRKGQCRFMLFVRLKPGVPSHFNNQSRTGYYNGDKYTDKESEMLRNLIKMLDKRLSMYDRVELYDNDKPGDERIILKITDGVIDRNQVHLYSLMLTNYILPQWLKKE